MKLLPTVALASRRLSRGLPGAKPKGRLARARADGQP